MIKTFKYSNKNKDKQYVLRLYGVSIWAMALSNGLGWMRILRKGIHWKDTTKHRLYFSERNGYRKALNIGKWRLSLLP
jgi:hypothetical protein